MAIDFATFLNVSKHVLNAKLPIMLRGRHGIGKSEVVYQIADTMQLPVVERRASQMTEGDLVGLPSIDGNRTKFNPPDWYKQACEKACLLFLDEVDRATVEVRQGIFELTDSRKLNGHKLHESTLIVAAVNGGEHGAQYQVGEMDPAELDRWTVFDVEPNVEDWLNWARGRVHDVIYDYINQNRNYLEHSEKEFEPNKVYPSRRSWKRLSDTLTSTKLLETAGKDLIPLSAAFIGFEGAVHFQSFVRDYDKQVLPADIIDQGNFNLIEKFGINDHAALIEKIDQTGALNQALSLDQLTNIANYFASMPSETSMKLYELLGASPFAIENMQRMHSIPLRNGKVFSDHVADLFCQE
jgi:midasin (ATPase involved in ribosome maturation)